MSRIVSTSRCPKGRLLHYFPRKISPRAEGGGGGSGGGDAEQGLGSAAAAATAAREGGGASAEDSGEGGSRGNGEDDGAFSDWCGWHHDHSSLTGAPSTEDRRGDARLTTRVRTTSGVRGIRKKAGTGASSLCLR